MSFGCDKGLLGGCFIRYRLGAESHAFSPSVVPNFRRPGMSTGQQIGDMRTSGLGDLIDSDSVPLDSQPVADTLLTNHLHGIVIPLHRL